MLAEPPPPAALPAPAGPEPGPPATPRVTTPVTDRPGPAAVPRPRARADRPANPAAAYWRRLLPALALLALVTRLPSFRHPLWSPDEGYLAVQARMLAAGGVLYDTVVDRKPPLLPWLYEATFALLGDSTLSGVRALAVLAHLVTAALLAATARHRWGDRAGRTAGVLYLLVSVGLNPEDTQAATFEVFILPFTAAAMWCAGKARWGAAGLAVAGALLTKQTGGAVLLPVLWLLGRTPRAPLSLARLAAGLALPLLATALLTTPSGLLFWTVTGSGSYATPPAPNSTSSCGPWPTPPSSASAARHCCRPSSTSPAGPPRAATATCGSGSPPRPSPSSPASTSSATTSSNSCRPWCCWRPRASTSCPATASRPH